MKNKTRKLLLAAGENIELAKKEVRAIAEDSSDGEMLILKNRLIISSSKISHPKRLGLVHEISKQVEIVDEPENCGAEYTVDGRYAVEARILEGDRDPRKVERGIGEALSTRKNSVDLDNPDTVIKAYILEDEIILGRLEQEIDRGKFNQRKNQNRPFSSPVSLDSKLARTLVNLSGVKPGERVLDPFCGTGGILIEAGLCGVGVAGTDIDQEMVKGCRENLEQYGIINHDIRQESAEKAPEAFDKDFDAIVTDLPYGRSSKKTKDIVEKFMDSIEAYDCKKVIMWNKDTLDGRNPNFSIDVHSSLTRYIYIID
jgi:tRNA (guanine10-N2)-dimethyltransferase